MRWLQIVVTLSIFWMGTQVQAARCFCEADPYSKTYEEKGGIINHWWGGKRAWSCVYTCTDTHGEVTKVVGHHKKTYIGADDGLWGICDGLTYENEYNTFKNDFVYFLAGSTGLDPANSTSPDLVKYAEENCQE